MSTDTYRVKLTKQALKDLKNYRGDARRVKEKLDVLKTDPLAGHSLAGTLSGTRSLEFSLKGSGQHRAIYIVRELTSSCVVFLIGPHENIYERAERRFKALDIELDE